MRADSEATGVVIEAEHGTCQITGSTRHADDKARVARLIVNTASCIANKGEILPPWIWGQTSDTLDIEKVSMDHRWRPGRFVMCSISQLTRHHLAVLREQAGRSSSLRFS